MPTCADHSAESPLNRFFHPVLRASELRSQPKHIKVAGTPIALFRDAEGRAAAVLDRCPHRFAPLSAGWVQNGRITCPYHGWHFDRNGCGKSPSHPTLQMCNVPGFQVVERYNYIWVAGPDAPLDNLPDFQWDKFGFLDGMSIFFPAPIHVTLDNFGENEHTPFVHHRLGWNESQIPTLEYEGENHREHTVSRYHARQRNTLIGTLVGLRPNDYFHNEYDVRFNPVRLEHHIYWTDPSRQEFREFQVRAIVYHVPETDRTTWVHLFAFLKVADKPPLGGLLVPLVKWILTRMVRREIEDDAVFIPVVADVPNTTKGMRLGKFDATLVQNHRLLESIYWGRPSRPTSTNGRSSGPVVEVRSSKTLGDHAEVTGVTEQLVEAG